MKYFKKQATIIIERHQVPRTWSERGGRAITHAAIPSALLTAGVNLAFSKGKNIKGALGTAAIAAAVVTPISMLLQPSKKNVYRIYTKQAEHKVSKEKSNSRAGA